MPEADQTIWLDTLPEKEGMYWERCNNTGKRILVFVQAAVPHVNPLLVKQARVWTPERIKGFEGTVMMGQLVAYRNNAYSGLKSWCGPDLAPPEEGSND